jgi:hypothetical protein
MHVNPQEISERMEVVGSDGAHVGTVDHIEGNQIKLTKSDPASGGQHRFIPDREVNEIADGKVVLRHTAAQIQSGWGLNPI